MVIHMKERIRHFILLIILILIDQLSKYWVRTDLISRDIIIIPDVLKLQYHTNTGAVWGILTDKTLFLSIFTVIVLLLIILFYFKIPQARKYSFLKLSIIFIMAGAVGNLIDRIFLGHVIDFIYFELINFPLFNFADSYLVVASIVLIILSCFYYNDDDLMFVYKLFNKGKADKSVADTKAKEVTSDTMSDSVEDEENTSSDLTVNDGKETSDSADNE